MICDKVVNRKIKMKHFNSRSHKILNSSLVHRYSVKNLRQDEVKKTSRKYIADHRKKFVFFNMIMKWKVRKNNISKMISKEKISDKVNHNVHCD